MHSRTVQYVSCIWLRSGAASERWVSPEQAGGARVCGETAFARGGPFHPRGCQLGCQRLSEAFTDSAQASNVVRVRVGCGALLDQNAFSTTSLCSAQAHLIARVKSETHHGA